MRTRQSDADSDEEGLFRPIEVATGASEDEARVAELLNELMEIEKAERLAQKSGARAIASCGDYLVRVILRNLAGCGRTLTVAFVEERISRELNNGFCWRSGEEGEVTYKTIYVLSALYWRAIRELTGWSAADFRVTGGIVHGFWCNDLRTKYNGTNTKLFNRIYGVRQTIIAIYILEKNGTLPEGTPTSAAVLAEVTCPLLDAIRQIQNEQA